MCWMWKNQEIGRLMILLDMLNPTLTKHPSVRGCSLGALSHICKQMQHVRSKEGRGEGSTYLCSMFKYIPNRRALDLASSRTRNENQTAQKDSHRVQLDLHPSPSRRSGDCSTPLTSHTAVSEGRRPRRWWRRCSRCGPPSASTARSAPTLA
jgi:hypothetical protein